MAAKEISVKKYVVRLSGEECERLETLIRKGKSPARRVLKARILLKANVSEAGKGWSDNRIIGTHFHCTHVPVDELSTDRRPRRSQPLADTAR